MRPMSIARVFVPIAHRNLISNCCDRSTRKQSGRRGLALHDLGSFKTVREMIRDNIDFSYLQLIVTATTTES